MHSPTPAGLLVLFLSLPPVLALPLRDPSFAPPSFQLLPFLITLLPFPILAALKYFYLRFRRGQSIHAVPYAFSTQPSPFYLSLNPYLIGFFGSPHWETTISCRIHASLPLPLRNPPPIPLSFHPHSSQSDKSTTNTSTLVSSLSRKSRSIPFPLSRSSLPTTPLRSSTGPSHPLVPPSIHVSSSLSPTLMQIMAPVLNSSYDISSLIPPAFLRPPTDDFNPASALTTRSSLFLRTSLNVSPTPTLPFIFLPKHLPPSPTPSIHPMSPSPASLSLAVFHSPLASRIPVPKPVHTPSLRPESCVVMPRDWPQEIPLLDSSALSAPHDGSLSRRSTVSNALDPRLKSTRPLAILKSPRSLARSPSPPFDGSLASPRSPRLISQPSPRMTPSPAFSFLQGSQYEEWDLTDLQDLNGRLDVDAISRALGLGLGLGLPVAASEDNHDAEESEHVSSYHSDSAAQSENDAINDFDLPFVGQPNSAGSPVWNPQEGDLATFLGISLQMHVHGQPLSVIPEETSSEMGSSIDDNDEDLLFGLNASVAHCYGEKADVEGTISNARSASFVWDGSWREGESIARLSVGVAC